MKLSKRIIFLILILNYLNLYAGKLCFLNPDYSPSTFKKMKVLSEVIIKSKFCNQYAGFNLSYSLLQNNQLTQSSFEEKKLLENCDYSIDLKDNKYLIFEKKINNSGVYFQLKDQFLFNEDMNFIVSQLRKVINNCQNSSQIEDRPNKIYVVDQVGFLKNKPINSSILKNWSLLKSSIFDLPETLVKMRSDLLVTLKLSQEGLIELENIKNSIDEYQNYDRIVLVQVSNQKDKMILHCENNSYSNPGFEISIFNRNLELISKIFLKLSDIDSGKFLYSLDYFRLKLALMSGNKDEKFSIEDFNYFFLQVMNRYWKIEDEQKCNIFFDPTQVPQYDNNQFLITAHWPFNIQTLITETSTHYNPNVGSVQLRDTKLQFFLNPAIKKEVEYQCNLISNPNLNYISSVFIECKEKFFSINNFISHYNKSFIGDIRIFIDPMNDGENFGFLFFQKKWNQWKHLTLTDYQYLFNPILKQKNGIE